MEAECYFILPLVTAVSGRREERRAERESTPSAESLARPAAPTPRTGTGRGPEQDPVSLRPLILTQSDS